MAEDPKKGKAGGELDDWASAIDEWDANLSLPSPTGKVPKFDAEELADTPEEAALEPAAIAEAALEPAAIGEIALEADAADELAFEEAELTPPPAPRTPVPPTEPRTFEPSQPLPLEAPPLYAEPLPPVNDDPLMHLFEGDMELPEEAGHALGSLLGAEEGKTRIASAEVLKAAMEVPDDDGPGLYSEEEDAFGGGSTRVASADEFDKLLADTAMVGEGDERAAPPSPPPVQAQLPIAEHVVTIEPSYPDAPAGGFNQESTRVAGGAELHDLLASDADLEAMLPEPPSSAPRPSPMLPEPGSKLPSGRFAKPSERMAIPSERMATPKPSERMATPVAPKPSERSPIPAPPQPPRKPAPAPQPHQQLQQQAIDDLEVEMEVSPGVDVPDEDFYDDIVVVPAGDAAAQASAAAAATTTTAPAGDDEELFDLSVEPSLPLNATARSSDPDRTPLPVADSDVESSVPVEAAAPTQPLATGDSRPVVPTRLVAAALPLPTLVVPDLAPAQPLDPHYLRDQLALYDTERLLVPVDEPARVARLAFAAGRTAERLGEFAAARERYHAALDVDPEHAHALRGLRRLRMGEPGPREPLLTLLDREIARAAPGEKRGLIGIKAEVALSGGEEPVARAAYAAILEEQPGDLSALTGLVDLAASSSDDDLAAALGQLSAALGNTVDPATRAALLVERGRLDESAERVSDAVARFGEALHVDPTAAAAAWGLLRVAVRTPGVADDLDTHARLNDLLPPGPLKQALSRRLGVLRARQNDFAGARPPLQAAAADGDRLALLDSVAARARRQSARRSGGGVGARGRGRARRRQARRPPGRARRAPRSAGQYGASRGRLFACGHRLSRRSTRRPRARTHASGRR